MSHTIRRKNKAQPENFRKFTWVYAEDGSISGWVYIRLDGPELKEAIRLFHSEKGGTFGYSAPKYHRKDTSAKQRMNDKQELLRYRNNPAYEPMVYDKMAMEYWT